MHEKHLTEDLVRKLVSLAADEGGSHVTRIRVRLGALSHFTPEHFREHFEDAAAGTLAEGAEVQAELDTDPTAPGAQGVLLETVELELDREDNCAMVVALVLQMAHAAVPGYLDVAGPCFMSATLS